MAGRKGPLLHRVKRMTAAGSPDDCWRWLGHLNRDGYGQIRDEFGVIITAHRASYLVHVGPIAAGMEIDHLCRNRACVNPAHLEPVTHQQNMMRTNVPAAVNARKTHCIRGHEFTPENTVRRPRGYRACRTCVRDRARESYRRCREARAAS